MPGEHLGMEEEFFGNELTVADNGDLFSTVLGEKKLLNRQMQITSRKVARMLQQGDYVLGRVHDLYDSVSLIIIESADGMKKMNLAQENNALESEDGIRNATGGGLQEKQALGAFLGSPITMDIDISQRKAIGSTYAYIRITELVRGGGYVRNFREHIKIGDLLLARVIEVNPLGTYLSIADEGLGVLKANCSLCRGHLSERGRILVCNGCGNKESRKLAIVSPE